MFTWLLVVATLFALFCNLCANCLVRCLELTWNCLGTVRELFRNCFGNVWGTLLICWEFVGTVYNCIDTAGEVLFITFSELFRNLFDTCSTLFRNL